MTDACTSAGVTGWVPQICLIRRGFGSKCKSCLTLEPRVFLESLVPREHQVLLKLLLLTTTFQISLHFLLHSAQYENVLTVFCIKIVLFVKVANNDGTTLPWIVSPLPTLYWSCLQNHPEALQHNTYPIVAPSEQGKQPSNWNMRSTFRK